MVECSLAVPSVDNWLSVHGVQCKQQRRKVLACVGVEQLRLDDDTTVLRR
jgi:hypothetical protein